MSDLSNPYKARIAVSQHMQQSWRAHSLMTDFKIEDVWRLPVTLTADQKTALVRNILFDGLSDIEQKGVAGFLFRIRLSVGRVLGWDTEPETEASLPDGSLRERYAKAEGLTAEQFPKPTGGAFVPVFLLEDESLDELENATVHAALHLGRVPLDDTHCTVQMTIYVKPNGVLGQMYMAVIKPFRYWIVYPAIMRLVEREFLQLGS